MNPIYRRGEPKKTKAFTPYALCHNHLRHTGEGVKAKNENRLTRARTREGKKGKIKWQPLAPHAFRTFKIEVQQIIHFFVCKQLAYGEKDQPLTRQCIPKHSKCDTSPRKDGQCTEENQ